MSEKPVETMSFEEAMAALEQVVGALERGMSGGPSSKPTVQKSSRMPRKRWS
jgi:hypothetical protein